MKKINFWIKDDLFRKFKKHCVDKDKTMTDIFIKMIKKELKSNE